MELDKAGIDYLIAVAKDAGFGLIGLDTSEGFGRPPEFRLHFQQQRVIVKPQPTVAQEEPPSLQESPKEAAQRLAYKDPMLTLDDA